VGLLSTRHVNEMNFGFGSTAIRTQLGNLNLLSAVHPFSAVRWMDSRNRGSVPDTGAEELDDVDRGCTDRPK